MPNKGMNVATPQSDDWRTPPWLFKALDAEFGFNFDAAANAENALCSRWTNCIDKSAIAERGEMTDRVFCNPPYSMIDKFVWRALYGRVLWVLVLPVRTDTDWFAALHNTPVRSRCVTLRFFRKRIEFHDATGKPAGSPRFASMIAIVKEGG